MLVDSGGIAGEGDWGGGNGVERLGCISKQEYFTGCKQIAKLRQMSSVFRWMVDGDGGGIAW